MSPRHRRRWVDFAATRHLRGLLESWRAPDQDAELCRQQVVHDLGQLLPLPRRTERLEIRRRMAA